MKKNGFTLIELITSFALSSIIILLLLNLIFSMKNVYTKTDTKTKLLIEQANLSKSLNDIINNENIVDITCTPSTSIFECNFIDKETTTYKLSIDRNNKIISFNDYTYKLDENSSFGDITGNQYINCYETTSNCFNYKYNYLLQIEIPITNKLFEGEDFGIKLSYSY